MHRAVSIHIGVNEPGGAECTRDRLEHSENAAWQMAVLAGQAGYESMQILRGRAATRYAVHNALAAAAGILEAGDNLLVTFSGHGGHVEDVGDKESHDESWCLFDGELSDDKLAGYWRVFDAGVRIVVVSESCFSGGLNRTGECMEDDAGDEDADRPRGGSSRWADVEDPRERTRGGEDEDDGWMRMRDGGAGDAQLRMRDGGVATPAAGAAPRVDTGGAAATAPCITEPPRDASAIRASVLMLAASSERETAGDGVYSGALRCVWNDGKFEGSYCELHAKVSQLVLAERPEQRPQIFLVGTATPEFALEPAFHVDRTPAALADDRRYRGEHGQCAEVEEDEDEGEEEEERMRG